VGQTGSLRTDWQSARAAIANRRAGCHPAPHHHLDTIERVWVFDAANRFFHGFRAQRRAVASRLSPFAE
jgi:hypothetical protein